MNLDETFRLEGAVAPDAQPDRVQVGAFQPRSLVAGPGVRAVVWVAGCLRRCPGCMKPDLFAFDSGASISVDRLASRILDVPGLEGVTYSGGEPFEQALSLARLAGILRAAGMSVLVYSGYQIDALREQESFRRLLDVTDILIDGEYRQQIPGPLRWRGSLNQRVHVLSDRGGAVPMESDQVCEVQASVTPVGMRLTGFPSAEIEHELSARLATRGIVMRPADLGDLGL